MWRAILLSIRPFTSYPFQPDYLAPLVCFLSSSENQKQTGGVFESWAGWVGQYRWQRAGGYAFPAKSIPTPEDYAEKYAVYTNFGSFLTLYRCHLPLMARIQRTVTRRTPHRHWSL